MFWSLLFLLTVTTAQSINKHYLYTTEGLTNADLQGVLGATLLCQVHKPSNLTCDSEVPFVSFDSNNQIRDISAPEGSIFGYPTGLLLQDSSTEFLTGTRTGDAEHVTIGEALNITDDYWTGSNGGGYVARLSGQFDYTCSGFTSAATGEATVGSSDTLINANTYYMSAPDYESCSSLKRLLCVCVDRTYTQAPTPKPTAPPVFVKTDTFSGSSKIYGATVAIFITALYILIEI